MSKDIAQEKTRIALEQAQEELTVDTNWGISVERDEQLSVLVRKLLTYIEATYSDYEQRNAHKRLVKDTIYTWYYDVYDNQHEEKSLRGYSREMVE